VLDCFLALLTNYWVSTSVKWYLGKTLTQFCVFVKKYRIKLDIIAKETTSLKFPLYRYSRGQCVSGRWTGEPGKAVTVS